METPPDETPEQRAAAYFASIRGRQPETSPDPPLIAGDGVRVDGNMVSATDSQSSADSSGTSEQLIVEENGYLRYKTIGDVTDDGLVPE